MYCAEGCDPNGHSNALQQQQQQQQLGLPNMQQTFCDYGKKEEHGRVGMCFVTERPEGLSIDCNVPMPSSFNLDAFSTPPLRTNNNLMLSNLQQSQQQPFGCIFAPPPPPLPTPLANIEPNNVFPAYNAGITNFAPLAPPTVTQQMLQNSAPICSCNLPTQSLLKPSSLQTKPTCACVPVQQLLLQQPTTQQSSPASQTQNMCNCVPPPPPQQQQTVAVDSSCLLSSCMCNQLSPNQQQQLQSELQQPCFCNLPVKQQQPICAQCGLKADDDQGTMRFDLPCFLADCNSNSLPLQPVQQQQQQQQLQNLLQQQQQQQLLQQQQQQLPPLQQSTQQQQQTLCFPSPCQVTSSVVDLNNNNNHNLSQPINNSNIYQHQQQQFQTPQQQQQATQLNQAQQTQQLNNNNKSCWCQGECTCGSNNNNNTNTETLANSSSSSGNPNGFQPTCAGCMKPGCTTCNCWHFPRCPNWCWHPHLGFMRVGNENNPCKNTVCNQRR